MHAESAFLYGTLAANRYFVWREQFQGFVSLLTPLLHTPKYGLVHGEINWQMQPGATTAR